MRLTPDLIGPLLSLHRTRLRLSQSEAALRAGVSTRLWAETERGERPNVSVASLLRMFEVAGVAVDIAALSEPAASPTPAAILSPARVEELKEDLRRAAEYGVDLSLIRVGLDLTPLERVRRNDEALEFFDSVTIEPGWVPERTSRIDRTGRTPRRPRAR